MKKIYAREYYLEQIRGFYHADLIKVITGIRRCGKSCFLLSVMEDLKSRGVKDKDIIYINLDKRGYKGIKTPEQLDEAIKQEIHNDDYKYLFIDEIQNVKGFETLINAYRTDGNYSIFITGSNSYLLSGELVTKLTGRYIEVEMFTLSFYEFLQMKKFLKKEISPNQMDEFNEYIRFGGFPQTLEFDKPQDKSAYIDNLIKQIIQKDISSHKKIKDKALFEKVRSYIINNFGATINVNSLASYLTNECKTPISRRTLNSYIEVLENAKIIYRCPRFDIKSRRSLKNEPKYYLADLGIYFANNVDNRINYGPALENILFLYFKMKDYEIGVGRIGKLECDFIIRNFQDYFYIQVAMSTMDEKTFMREVRPFEVIKDYYPRYLFTLDIFQQNYYGIKSMNIIDFIKENKDL